MYRSCSCLYLCRSVSLSLIPGRWFYTLNYAAEIFDSMPRFGLGGGGCQTASALLDVNLPGAPPVFLDPLAWPGIAWPGLPGPKGTPGQSPCLWRYHGTVESNRRVAARHRSTPRNKARPSLNMSVSVSDGVYDEGSSRAGKKGEMAKPTRRGRLSDLKLMKMRRRIRSRFGTLRKPAKPWMPRLSGAPVH